MLPFASEGYPFVLVPALAGILSFLFGAPAVAIGFWIVMAACVLFFRDPARVSAAPPEVVLAPADGKVLSVGSAPQTVAVLGLSQQVSIFMSPMNVHVNRAPITGTAREVRHTPGAKLPAFRDKASDLNEHTFVVLEGALGTVAYKQIAGSLARRIVCDLAVGQSVRRGDRVGLIKFGSRVDLFLPPHAVVDLTVGQRTRAGVTAVAHLALSRDP